jgi:isoleucyl-tRNA synthetase
MEQPFGAATLPEKINFSAEEQRVLELWQRLDAFKRSMELTKGKPEVSCADSLRLSANRSCAL